MEETQTPPPPPRRRTSATRVLLALTGLGAVAFLGSAAAVWYLVTGVDAGEVEDGTFLHVELAGQLSDEPQQGGLFAEPEDLPPTTTEIAQAIRAAAGDDRITGLYLDLMMPSAGWASFQEVRDALQVFEDAGKPCVSYTAAAFGNGDYFLATACDQVLMAPAGVMLVTGLAMEMTYYKGTFEKLGVEPEFEHVGDFKSFIEAYELDGPSESAKEAYEALLTSVYDQLISGIAEGRGLDVAVVADHVDHPRMTPASALERDLIDGLAFPDAMRYRVHKLAEEGWLESLAEPLTDEELEEDHLTPLNEYLKGIRADETGGGDRIAVVQAQGSITSGEGGGGLFGDDGNLTDGEFSKWMKEVREDDRVKAVVMRVNSPGGSGLAASMMWREVERTRDAGKPVVVSMGDLAASGGYLMSCNADWIIAQPGTITGSIGVFGGKFDLSGTSGKLGMTTYTYKRGELSDLLSFGKPFSEEGRQVFKEYLGDFYQQFVQDVADGRGLEWDAVHAVAQGRVWTGEQAIQRGLVDELGGLQAALDKAAELAELDDYGLVRVPKRRSFMESLIEDLAQSRVRQVGVEMLLPIDAARRAELSVLEDMSRTGAVGAMLPGSLRIH